MDLAPEAAAKAAIYAAVLLALGASATRWLLLPRVVADAGLEAATAIERALARIARLAAALMLAAQAFRAVAHTASAFGWGDALAWDQLSVIVFESRWSGGWRIQVAAALFLLVSTLLIGVRRSTGWALATAGALACAASLPLIGHAASDPFNIVLHSVHVLGAGLWLGTLACIVLVRGAAARLLPHFSTIAFAGASMAAMAGLIAAVQYIDSPSNLWLTAYGRTLVLKLAFVAAIFSCGFSNFRRWSAAKSGSDAGRIRSPRLAVLEASLAAAVIAVTSFLTELAHP